MRKKNNNAAATIITNRSPSTTLVGWATMGLVCYKTGFLSRCCCRWPRQIPAASRSSGKSSGRFFRLSTHSVKRGQHQVPRGYSRIWGSCRFPLESGSMTFDIFVGAWIKWDYFPQSEVRVERFAAHVFLYYTKSVWKLLASHYFRPEAPPSLSKVPFTERGAIFDWFMLRSFWFLQTMRDARGTLRTLSDHERCDLW